MYREEGAARLVSKQRGQKSNHQLSQVVKQESLDQIKHKYSDFEPTLARVKLRGKREAQISLESVRQLMIAEKIWKP